MLKRQINQSLYLELNWQKKENTHRRALPQTYIGGTFLPNFKQISGYFVIFLSRYHTFKYKCQRKKEDVSRNRTTSKQKKSCRSIHNKKIYDIFLWLHSWQKNITEQIQVSQKYEYMCLKNYNFLKVRKFPKELFQNVDETTLPVSQRNTKQPHLLEL